VPETLSLHRSTELGRYENKIFVRIELNRKEQPVAVFVARHAEITVPSHRRTDPCTTWKLDVADYTYRTKLIMRRSQPQVKRDWEIFGRPGIEQIFPWCATTLCELKCAAVAFDDFHRQAEYQVRYRNQSPAEIAGQISRGEDIAADEQRLPLVFIVSKLVGDEQHSRLAALLSGQADALDWDNLPALLAASPINQALWTATLSDQAKLRRLAQEFWKKIDQIPTDPEKTAYFVQGCQTWFSASPDHVCGAIRAGLSGRRWLDRAVIHNAVDELIRSPLPNLQIGSLRALPDIWDYERLDNPAVILSPPGDQAFYGRLHTLFVSQPIALRNQPPTPEVGAEAAKACATIQNKIHACLQQDQVRVGREVALAQAKISQLLSDLTKARERLCGYQEEMEREVSTARLAEAIFCTSRNLG
jgi:hypothetical protein